MPTQPLSANMEDYLETIASLTKDLGVARVKEIGGALAVKSASVHAALHLLVDKGLIQHEHYGYVRLTEDGACMAEAIIRRHEMLEGFLRDFLGVPPATARNDACRMEHAISEGTSERLSRFIAFLRSHTEWTAWAEAFRLLAGEGAAEGLESRLP